MTEDVRRSLAVLGAPPARIDSDSGISPSADLYISPTSAKFPFPPSHPSPPSATSAQHEPRGGTPNQQRFVPLCPSGQPRSSWPDTGGLLDLTFAPQRVLLRSAAPPRADGPLAPRARSSGRAESRTARFSRPVQSHLPGSPSLRLAQGVLWGRHAASRPPGRRAGTQHGRQTRPRRRAESRTAPIVL